MFHTEIEATSLCNTRCLHCPHEAISRPAGRMSWETYATVIGKIRRHVKEERFSLSFSGMGEPLLNPLIFKFIKHVSGDAVTSFASNGAALTEDSILKLIEAGLDTIYFSFNGDEPGIFSKMMGGLSHEKVLANLRAAVSLSRGTRLKLRANVSITKANQDRVTRIKTFLEDEQVGPVTFSLCHSRGGNLRDTDVCDTPPMEVAHWTCDVMANTLFVDWQGRAHICDHDIHGEYELGDLMCEPLEAILERRQKLLIDSSGLKICRECNDIMRVGGTFPLASRAGGSFRDWIYYLHRDLEDPLSEANEPMKWIYRIYQKENRTDRFANRLLGIEKAVTAERNALALERDALARNRDAIFADRDHVQGMLNERDRQFAELHAEYVGIQAVLEGRNHQIEALHAECLAIRRHWLWRIIRMMRNDVARFGRIFGVSR